jgi:hypothetical protein
MKMHIFTPAFQEEAMIVSLSDNRTISEIDTVIELEMCEIEGAKSTSDVPAEVEEYWAGRLLADRKSTRFAA